MNESINPHQSVIDSIQAVQFWQGRLSANPAIVYWELDISPLGQFSGTYDFNRDAARRQFGVMCAELVKANVGYILTTYRN